MVVLVVLAGAEVSLALVKASSVSCFIFSSTSLHMRDVSYLSSGRVFTCRGRQTQPLWCIKLGSHLDLTIDAYFEAV